jgi:electron transport complex protein RnfG
MKEIIKLALILFSISFVAAIALKTTEQVTAEPIQKQINAANELARKAVFPDADGFEAIEPATLDELKADFDVLQEVFYAKKGNEVIGFVVKTTPNGFAGPIEVVTGISNDSKLMGVRIGTMTETPGLGDLAKKPEFYEQYVGKGTSTEIGVAKSAPKDSEIQALTGATITSRAVTLGVNTSVQIVDLIK